MTRGCRMFSESLASAPIVAALATVLLVGCGEDDEPEPYLPISDAGGMRGGGGVRSNDGGVNNGPSGAGLSETEVLYVRETGAGTVFEAIDLSGGARRIVVDAVVAGSNLTSVAPRGFALDPAGERLWFDAVDGTGTQGIFTGDLVDGTVEMVQPAGSLGTLSAPRYSTSSSLVLVGGVTGPSGAFTSSALYTMAIDGGIPQRIDVPAQGCDIITDPTVFGSTIYALRLGCAIPSDAGLFEVARNTAVPLVTFVLDDPTQTMALPVAVGSTVYVVVDGDFDTNGDLVTDTSGAGLLEYDVVLGSSEGIFSLTDAERRVRSATVVLPDGFILDIEDSAGRSLATAPITAGGTVSTIVSGGGDARNPAVP